MENLLNKYGEWAVIKAAPPKIRANGGHRPMVFCRCSCGTERVVAYENLKGGKSTNCGCLRAKGVFKKPVEVGNKYQRWTVIDTQPQLRKGRKFYLCKCECGTEKYVERGNLLGGLSKSCGCWNIEAIINRSTTHGLSSHPLYRVWSSMRERCNNPKDKSYKNYGGRGIRVCERWLSFDNFYEDMGPKPDGLSLDRIDNDGHYTPSNCKWATAEDQQKNKRTNRIITYKEETMCLMDWAEKTGIAYDTLRYRLDNEWSLAEVFEDMPRATKFIKIV